MSKLTVKDTARFAWSIKSCDACLIHRDMMLKQYEAALQDLREIHACGAIAAARMPQFDVAHPHIYGCLLHRHVLKTKNPNAAYHNEEASAIVTTWDCKPSIWYRKEPQVWVGASPHSPGHVHVVSAVQVSGSISGTSIR